jgi:RNA polymerase sigma-70 factor (ECF subfamily)
MDVQLGASPADTPSAHWAAIESVYDRFYDRIYRYCAYRLYDKSWAEDVTGTVFLRVVERIDELRLFNETELRHWLYGAASNAVNACFRDRKKQSQILEAVRDKALHTAAAGQGEPAFDRPALYGAILRLKPKIQNIVTLRFVEGFTSAEIAEMTGMSDVAVRVALTRAVQRLRQALGKTGDKNGY